MCRRPFDWKHMHAERFMWIDGTIVTICRNCRLSFHDKMDRKFKVAMRLRITGRKKWWQLQMSLIYGDKRHSNPIGLNWYLQQYYQLISNWTVQKQFLLLLLLYIDVQNTLRFGFSWIFQWFLKFYWTVFFIKKNQQHSLKWCLPVKTQCSIFFFVYVFNIEVELNRIKWKNGHWIVFKSFRCEIKNNYAHQKYKFFNLGTKVNKAIAYLHI